jgi:hypothetical protein
VTTDLVTPGIHLSVGIIVHPAYLPSFGLHPAADLRSGSSDGFQVMAGQFPEGYPDRSDKGSGEVGQLGLVGEHLEPVG